MKKIYTIVIVLAFVFDGLSANAQILCIHCYDQNDSISHGVNNLVLNGGFENTTCTDSSFCPNSNLYNCSISNWICTGGGSQTYANIIDSFPGSISNVVEGTKAVYFGNWVVKACSTTYPDTSCLNNSS